MIPFGRIFDTYDRSRRVYDYLGNSYYSSTKSGAGGRRLTLPPEGEGDHDLVAGAIGLGFTAVGATPVWLAGGLPPLGRLASRVRYFGYMFRGAERPRVTPSTLSIILTRELSSGALRNETTPKGVVISFMVYTRLRGRKSPLIVS
jgi:hypothetical protein